MSPRGIEIERKFRLRAAPDEATLAAHGAVAKRIEQVYLQPGPSAGTAGGSHTETAGRPQAGTAGPASAGTTDRSEAGTAGTLDRSEAGTLDRSEAGTFDRSRARTTDRAEAADMGRIRRTELPDGTVSYRRNSKRRIGDFSFDETEEPISEAEWTAALAHADPERRPIRKTRHVVAHGEQSLEIDVFDAPAGLTVVEVELASEDEQVELPDWLGEWREVTSDRRYLNWSLARRDAEVPPFD